jgi:hypothetical protein
MRLHFKTLRGTAALAALAATLTMAPAASAFTFGSFTPDNAPVGNPPIFASLPTVGITAGDVTHSFTVNWLLPGNLGPGTNLSASATFEVLAFSSDALDLEISIENTTTASFQAAILALGFSTDPDTTGSYLVTGTVFEGIEPGNGPNQTFPGGFKFIDACLFAANNCSGGNVNNGLQSGNSSDTFQIRLSGTFGAAPAVELDSFPIKFQTQAGSFEFPGNPFPGNPNGVPPAQVPGPATLALLGAGFLGLAVAGGRLFARR